MYTAKSQVRLEVFFGFTSDIGRRRQENQDSWGTFSTTEPSGTGDHLFIVADGMGGHTRGQEASSEAIRSIKTTYLESDGESRGQRLKNALQKANLDILNLAYSSGHYEKMGTTCTVLLVHGTEGLIAHVGDSRAYRIRAGRIEQMTQDHTQVAELVREGVITKEEAVRHPRRSVLTRGLGVSDVLEVDLVDPFDIRENDSFILCSDGLLSIPETQLRDIVLANEPQAACDELVRIANENGGEDNITVGVIRIGSLQPINPRNGEDDTIRKSDPVHIPVVDEPNPANRMIWIAGVVVLLVVILIAYVFLT